MSSQLVVFSPQVTIGGGYLLFGAMLYGSFSCTVVCPTSPTWSLPIVVGGI